MGLAVRVQKSLASIQMLHGMLTGLRLKCTRKITVDDKIEL